MKCQDRILGAGLHIMAAAFACVTAIGHSAGPALAQGEELDYASTNIFGGVGLLRTRTARFAPDGQFEVGASFLNPYRNYYLNWQILPWAEVVFRYTDITNRPGQIRPIPQSTGKFFEDLIKFKNANTFLDRSFDFKFRLLKEGRYVPALAVGFQDAIGTGVFSGEYLVASKRFGRLDLHLGMGWGVLGSRGDITNPFRIFGSRFKTRSGFSGRGGQFSFGNYFSGPTVGLFGGAEYVTRLDNLTIKFEYNGTDPATVSGEDALDEDLPIGIGINYRPAPWFDFGLGFERGNTVSLRFALRTNFNTKGLPKTQSSPPAMEPRPKETAASPQRGALVSSLARSDSLNRLYAELRATGVDILSFEVTNNSAHLRLSGADSPNINSDLEFEVAELTFSRLPWQIRTVELDWIGPKEARQSVSIPRTLLRDVSKIENQLAHPRKGAAVPIVSGSRRQYAAALGMPISVSSVQSGREFSDFQMESLGQELLYKEAAAPNTAKAPRPDGAQTALGRTTAVFGAGPLHNGWVGPAPAVSTASTTLGMPLGAEPTKAYAEPMFVELARYGFGAYSLQIYETSAVLQLVRAPYREGPINLAWSARIAANHLPNDIEEITIVEKLGALEVSRITVLRADLERQAQGRGSPSEILAHTEFETPHSNWQDANRGYVRDDVYPAFDWWLAPELQQHIGDPSEGIYLADVDLELGFVYAFTQKIGFSFVGRRFLFGNLDRIKRRSNSVLPRVRSDIVQYLQNGRTHIERLQADYITGLAPNWYFRASGGLFEGMFGGLGGEIMYNHFAKPWAVAVDINWVKQRGFNQLFSFRDYDVVTGHATLYYELPFYDMRATISAGRYLAKDRGVTIDISRRFRSGIRVGAFATFTNVSAEDFGEGSFDKGFYISVPLELLLTRRTLQTANFLFRPLTRDGGQKLLVGPRLYDFFEDRKKADFERDWNAMFE